MKKLALLGNTGVGKDTAVKIIQKRFNYLSLHLIQLASPLYEAQNAIYKICGKEKDPTSQDGILLNFLGQHMRHIAPDVIQAAFLRTLQKHPQADLAICTDARPVDIPFIKEAGFTILQITADPRMAQERRKARGDLSLGSSDHTTESGASSERCDMQIQNIGGLEEFEQKIVQFLRGWMA